MESILEKRTIGRKGWLMVGQNLQDEMVGQIIYFDFVKGKLKRFSSPPFKITFMTSLKGFGGCL